MSLNLARGSLDYCEFYGLLKPESLPFDGEKEQIVFAGCLYT